MDSILWQLKKYQQPPPIDPPTKIESTNLIQKSSNSISTIANELMIHPNQLNNVPNYKYTGILYPFKLMCIYHLVRTGKVYTGAEAACDNAIQQFMEQNSNDIENYTKIFHEASNDIVKKLIAARILVATFQFGERKLDFLPKPLKFRACELLNFNKEPSLSEAMNMIEKLHQRANLEEQILGRLGYLMMWKSLTGEKQTTVGLLENQSR